MCVGFIASLLAFVFTLVSISPADAQTGAGGLRGYVKDDSGGVLPGVTVTAISSELLTPVVNVTDETGLYRLNRPIAARAFSCAPGRRSTSTFSSD
jgi:hypothetical protein